MTSKNNYSWISSKSGLINCTNKSKKLNISVVIPTRNRPEKLANCLCALRKSSVSEFELIVVDQSDEDKRSSSIMRFLDNFSKIVYIRSKSVGKSKGLNLGISLTTTKIIAFTDDDCIPEKEWLFNIQNAFRNPNIDGVLGDTKPYQPERHRGYICPSTFKSKNPKAHVIAAPCRHWDELGIGSNMAFRKKVFDELGGFKEWLGPGAIGCSAEDAEIMLRMLISRRKLFYDPKVLVYHDRWITTRESNFQRASYVCGEVSCYGYLALTGNRFAYSILKDSLIGECFSVELKNILSNLVHFRLSVFKLGFWWVFNIIARLKGGIIAMYFAFS